MLGDGMARGPAVRYVVRRGFCGAGLVCAVAPQREDEVVTRSALFDTIRDCYGDQYGLTWVRDLPEAEVLTRLGVDGSASYPRRTAREAVARLGFDTPAVRVGRSGSGPSCST
ncbi:hypothetical protein NKH77_17640 [Streptomyces sp. M19]